MYHRNGKARLASGKTVTSALVAVSLVFAGMSGAVAAQDPVQTTASETAVSDAEQSQEAQADEAKDTSEAPEETAAPESNKTAAEEPDSASNDVEETAAPVPTKTAQPQAEKPTAAPQPASTPSPAPSKKATSDTPVTKNSGSTKKSATAAVVAQATNKMTWGVRESFRSYILSPIAHGTITLKGNVLSVADGFDWSYNAAKSDLKNARLGFDGQVNFKGHKDALDVTFKDPRISLVCESKAVLSVVATTKAYNGVEALNGERIQVGEFDLKSNASINGGVLTLNSEAGVITARGESAFAGFYPEGEELDSFKISLSGMENLVIPTGSCDRTLDEPDIDNTPAPTPKPTQTPKPTPTKKPTSTEESKPSAKPSARPSSSSKQQIGSLKWGFKKSFRDYITGPIAQGTVDVGAGASDAGDYYEFPQKKSSVKNGTGTINYSGFVQFVGHHAELNSTFTDPTIKLTSKTAGEIIATANTLHYTKPDQKFTGQKIVVAKFKNAQKTKNKDGSSTYTSSEVTLTADGARSFSQFYDAGTKVDNVSFTVGANAGDVSAAPVKAKSAGTYKGATVNKKSLKPGGEFTIKAGGFGANTKNIELAVYSKKTVIKTGLKADAQGTVAVTAKLPKDLPAGTHTLSLEAPNGVKQQVKITVNSTTLSAAVAQETAQAPQAPVCVAQAVAGATASWGIKTSYTSYVSRLSDGTVATSGVSRSGNTFNWGSGSGKYNAEVGMGSVAFGGSVRFTGHKNVMDTQISGIRIQISGNTGYVYANVAAKGLENDGLNKNGALLAKVNLAGKQVVGNKLTVNGAPTTLTSEGAEAFGGFYNAGDALDPISFSLPLGADTTCDNGTGATLAKFGGKGGNLAKTGAQGMSTSSAAAAFLLLVGSVALLGSRRRAVRAAKVAVEH